MDEKSRTAASKFLSYVLRHEPAAVVISVVNDFCPVQRGLVGVRLQGVPNVEYHVVTRPGAERESRDTLVRMILESPA